MKNRMNRLMALLRIEIGVSYRYPIIEGIILLIFLVPLLTTMSLWFDTNFRIDDFDKITYAVIGFPKLQLRSILGFGTSLWVIMIAVLPAFSIAKSFEDGYIQTLLTYPIARMKLLLVKITLVILIPAITFTAMLLFAGLVVFPELPLLSDMTVVLLGAWVSFLFYASLSSLIAVTSKKVSTTAIFGIAYPFVAGFLQNLSTIPGIIRVVLDPFNAVWEFLNSSARNIVYDVESTITLIDLQYGFSILIIISIVLLAANLWIFKRSQI